MTDLFIDVLLEVPVSEMRNLRRPSVALVDRSREEADRKCAEAGARLRTDHQPEFEIGQAVSKATGEDMVLVASRWAVVGPDALETTRPEEMR